MYQTSKLVHILYGFEVKTRTKAEMKRKRQAGDGVCTSCKPDGATTARLPSASAEPVSRRSIQVKTNGILDIRWPRGAIHVQNVLNKQISSYSVRYLG